MATGDIRRLIDMIKDQDGENSGLDADLLRGLPADFTCSKTESGYTKLPNGLIIQWGLYPPFSFSANDTENVSITFPVAFPNVTLNVKVSKYIDRAGSAARISADVKIGTITTSGFTIAFDNTDVDTRDVGAFWLAIGY